VCPGPGPRLTRAPGACYDPRVTGCSRPHRHPRPAAFALLALVGAIACGSGATPGGVGVEAHDHRFNAVVPAGAVVETLATGFGWAEGPAWDARGAALLFSDVPAGRVYRWSAARGLEPAFDVRRPGAPSGTPGSNGLAFDAEGRLLLAHHGERALLRRESDSTFTVLAGGFEGRRFNSPNDMAVAADGSLYFSDPPYGLPKTFRDPARQLEVCGVYRWSPDGRVARLVDHLEAPNGVALAPDGRTLYVTDVRRGRGAVWAFPLADDGAIAGDPTTVGRLIFDLSRSPFGAKSVPDGLAVNSAGHLIVAGSAGVLVMTGDGALLGRIRTGDFATNVTLGGDSLEINDGGAQATAGGGAPATETPSPRRRDLYITTSRSLLRVRLVPRRAPWRGTAGAPRTGQP
jgi:gluconolactonase